MLFHNYIKDRTNRIANDVACPHWSQSKTGYTSNKAAYGKAFIPGGIGEF